MALCARTLLFDAPIIILTLYFLGLEVLQLYNPQQTLFKYLLDLTNFIDIFSGILNIVLVLNEISNYSVLGFDLTKLFAMLAIFFVWYKVFYWMRLFTKPAFFMNLLSKTFGGMMSFVLMLMILLLMLSNVLYILNMNDVLSLEV